MTYATYEDVEDRFGETLSGTQITQVNVWLADVERRLRRRIPDLDDRAALDPDYLAEVISVESEAVIRILKNPDGFRAEAEGSYSYSTDVRTSSGFMLILEDEWTRLGASGAFTIRTNRGYPRFNPITDLRYGEWIWDQHTY